MDVRIEATPVCGVADVMAAVVRIETVVYCEAIFPVGQVASFSCPSIGGTSISAVSPDAHDFDKEVARAF